MYSALFPRIILSLTKAQVQIESIVMEVAKLSVQTLSFCHSIATDMRGHHKYIIFIGVSFGVIFLHFKHSCHLILLISHKEPQNTINVTKLYCRGKLPCSFVGFLSTFIHLLVAFFEFLLNSAIAFTSLVPVIIFKLRHKVAGL